jgi:hypothetical protein
MLKCISAVIILHVSAASLIGPQEPSLTVSDPAADKQPNNAASGDARPGIPAGHLAYVIRHTPQDGSVPVIGPFDRVDVIHIVSGGGGKDYRQVILKGVLVLDTFQDPPLVYFAPVTLAVTPAQAHLLDWAMSVGELRLGLRKYGDEGP